MPEKMLIKKFDPVARKHVEYKGNEAEVISFAPWQTSPSKLMLGGDFI